MFSTFINSVLQAEIAIQEQQQGEGMSALTQMKENIFALNILSALQDEHQKVSHSLKWTKTCKHVLKKNPSRPVAHDRRVGSGLAGKGNPLSLKDRARLDGQGHGGRVYTGRDTRLIYILNELNNNVNINCIYKICI